jgi:hypothetical protein
MSIASEHRRYGCVHKGGEHLRVTAQALSEKLVSLKNTLKLQPASRPTL